MIKVVLPFIILSIGLVIAYILSKNKPQKKKQIIWGIALIIVVAPCISWVIGGLYVIFGSVETTGWEGIINPVLIFLLIFLIGIGYLVKGILNKEKVS